MNEDEELARKLQEEFDREAEEIEHKIEEDTKFANIVAADSHNISDSDEEKESDISILKEIPDNGEKNPGKEKAIKRPVCQYGAKCYRKNDIHLKEFFHPNKESQSHRDSLGSQSIKRRKLYSNTNSPNWNSSSSNSSRKNFIDRLETCQPQGFFLNKIFSLPATQKDSRTLVFPDLLNPKMGTLIESAQLNFMIDLEFVMDFYKVFAPKMPVLFMYGSLEGQARDYEGVTCVKVNMPFQYGVHHTKMMLFHYKEGLRVVIHTANLIPDDWNEKTQGFWVSSLFPPLENGEKSLLKGDSSTSFKRDLTDYLLSYKCPDLTRWSHIIRGHDFSSCKVHFVASVPGYHTGENRFKYGHLKCRQLLKKNGSWKYNSSTSPVVVQCSSIGSLGKDSKSWLTGELGVSLIGGNETNSVSVNVLYPSEEDVRNSTQGYGGGSCLPYNSNTHEKQTWLKGHFHCWRSEVRQRTKSMPHIKTYTRLSPDLKRAQYLILTSSNLSKAAWGQLQKQRTQLFIRSYEAGVLWFPEKQGNDNVFTLSKRSNEKNELTLPFDLPLQPYSSDDVPWFMNTNKSIPDVLGNTYP